MPVATLFGICGGSGAGKTTLAVEIIRSIGIDNVAPLAFDAYYRDLSHLTVQQRMEVNYDHPDSLDAELFLRHLTELRAGRAIEVPDYDMVTHTRTGATTHVEARSIVLVEGVLLFALPGIGNLLDRSVFIDVPEDIRLERRVRRDVAERGRAAADVRRQFHEFVVPMHNEHVQPYDKMANRTVGADEDLSDVAAELAAELVGPASQTA